MTVPVVWDAVDCISQLYRHGSHAGATLPLRLLGKLEAERVCACEWAQLQRFQHILVTAERERQALLALPQARQKAEVTAEAEGALAEITVLTHGIDPAYFQPYSGTRRPETLIFSGKMDFHANIAAACLLVQRIMPLIWRERPNARLIIAGSDPPAHIRSFASDSRIEVTGYLSDLRLVISQAQIAVCPLPYAVGVQNKVLEAMALGTPVVASSNVAAGLQAIGDQDLLIEDEPEAFASAVLRLLDDVSLRLSLAKKGIAYIATHHNWDTILQKLLAVYQRAISP
jgi:glycosyltransferase involved in cell wall biosynthesis